MVVIDLGKFETLLFDLDGVITRTAAVHARAWKRLFDEYLARRAARTGAPFVPFDLEADYRRYVDGKPRPAGVRSFLASRGIDVSRGAPGDDAGQETVHGLGKQTTGYFLVGQQTGAWPRRRSCACTFSISSRRPPRTVSISTSAYPPGG